jgi:uncharacterized 2Fe-2S/4Fe-4S cluster protein (DUF4445 family)
MKSKRAIKKIIFQPMGRTAQVPQDTPLLAAAIANEVPVRSDCGGVGSCFKCLVTVFPPESFTPLTDTETDFLSPEQVAAGCRLACQTRVLNSAEVRVPIEGVDSGEAVGKTGVSGVYATRPMIERIVVPADNQTGHERAGQPDIVGWLSARAKRVSKRSVILQNSHVIRAVSQLDHPDGEFTLVHHRQRGATAILSGRHDRSLGFAVDVGTTTLACYLCDLRSGRVLGSAGEPNPQRPYGEDVISRIVVAKRDENGLQLLQSVLIEALNRLFGRCLKKAAARREDIDEVSFVGNTTMEHLLLGINPYSIGRAPYLPTTRIPGDYPAADLGLALNPATRIYVSPVVSGFIGGDTLGATLAVEPHKGDDVCLIVDMGTNGELVLGTRGNLWATSCATGPALEGAHISCGMRAATGAICGVHVDPATRKTCYEVIGGSDLRPVGLCGSAIIDAVAELRRAGLIHESGRFNNDESGLIIGNGGKNKRFIIAPADQSATQKDVFVTLKDIRQVQLAKAAIEVGIRFLMQAARLDRIDRLILTGAFGARFNWKSAVTIGMLPQAAVTGRVETVENAAGVGAIKLLLDRRCRDDAVKLIERIQVVDLASQPNFNLAFAEATQFPPLNI